MNNKSIAILVTAITLGAASVGCLGAAYLRFEKARKAIGGASTIGEELAAMEEKMAAEAEPVECDEDTPERGRRQACEEAGAPANIVQAVFGHDALIDAEAELARQEKAAAKSASAKNKRKPVQKEAENDDTE